MSELTREQQRPVRVCGVLRERIISGAYEPGEKVTEQALAGEFGISRIPVREALRVLEAQGYVRVEPQRGTFVRSIGQVEAEHLLEVRRELEPLAASKAAKRRTAGQLDALHDLVGQARARLARRPTADLSSIESEFHRLVAACADNDTLAEILQHLRNKCSWVYEVADRGRQDDQWGDHEALVEALARRDSRRAAQLARWNLDRIARSYRFKGTAPAGRTGDVPPASQGRLDAPGTRVQRWSR